MIAAFCFALVASFPAASAMRHWYPGIGLGYLRHGLHSMLPRNLRGFDEVASFCQLQMEQLEQIQNPNYGEAKCKCEEWQVAKNDGKFAEILSDGNQFVKKLDGLLGRLRRCPQDFKAANDDDIQKLQQSKAEIEGIIVGLCQEQMGELHRIQDPQKGELWRKLADWRTAIKNGFKELTLSNVNQFEEEVDELLGRLWHCPNAASDSDILGLQETKARLLALKDTMSAWIRSGGSEDKTLAT